MDNRQLIADLLSALEYHTEQTRPIEFSKVAIQAAREYLQKPTQQEPVAWGVFEGNLHDMFFTEAEAVEMAQLKGTHAEVKPLYTTAQRTWVSPADKEIEAIWEVAMFAKYGVGAELSNQPFVHYARGIEAKLKELNT